MATINEVMNAKTVKDIIRLGGEKFKPEPEPLAQPKPNEKGELVSCSFFSRKCADGNQPLWMPDNKKSQLKRFAKLAGILQNDYGVDVCLHTTAEEFHWLAKKLRLNMAARDIVAVAQFLAPNPQAQQDFFGREDAIGGKILKTVRVRDGYAVVRIGRTYCRVKIAA